MVGEHFLLCLFIKYTCSLHPSLFAKWIINEFFIRLLVQEIGFLLYFEFPSGFNYQATLRELPVDCVLLHDCKLAVFSFERGVVLFEVRVKDVVSITFYHRIDFDFASDLSINSRLHFLSLEVGHLEIEAEMFRIHLILNVSKDIHQRVS